MRKEKLKNKLKRQNGITLIALVVTIIVLIILAVISINLVFNEGGIISKAEKTKEIQRAAEVAEQVEMWKSDKAIAGYMHEGKQKLASFLEELVQKGLITETEKATIEETGRVEIGGRPIIFGSDALTLVEMYEAGLSCTEENCTNPEHLHIGDYVNYENPTSVSITGDGYTTAGYTSPAAQTGIEAGNNINYKTITTNINQTYEIGENQLHWRVLGIDETTGGIKLIAGSPMKRKANATIDNLSKKTNDPYFYMYGAKAYVNGITELNKICAMYKNDLAEEARSVNIEDVNAITGITTADKIREVDIANSGTNPQGEKHQYEGTYEFANHWTPEAWLANKETPLEKISDTINGYGYYINAPAEAGVPSATVASAKQYKLLFENTESRSGKWYWLASSGVLGKDYSPNRDWWPGAYFGLGYAYGVDDLAVTSNAFTLFISYSYERDYGLAVRPVVILNSKVTIDDIQKTDQTEKEDTWNY